MTPAERDLYDAVIAAGGQPWQAANIVRVVSGQENPDQLRIDVAAYYHAKAQGRLFDDPGPDPA